MAVHGNNEGFRILDEYTCTAIPGAPIPPSVSAGRGVNDGIGIVSQLDVDPTPSAFDQTRIAALRAMSNTKLLDLIRASGATMNAQDLLTIHDIAAERLASGNHLVEAIELSREAMRAVVKRSA